MINRFFTLGFYRALLEEKQLYFTNREEWIRYQGLKEMCAYIREEVEKSWQTEQRPFLFSTNMYFNAGRRTNEFSFTFEDQPSRNLRVVEHKRTGLCVNPYVTIERPNRKIEALPPYQLIRNLMRELRGYRRAQRRLLDATPVAQLEQLAAQPSIAY